MAGYGGYLPFAGLANSGTNYNKDYNSALAMNAANYGNIYSGFGDLLARQQSSNQAIESGYSNRAANAMQLLAGMEQGQREDIQAGATRATSQNAQDLIGRGLSNSTVGSTMARGVEADKNRAVNNLVGQMAGTKANIYSALEGDRLQALGANNNQFNQIAQQRLAMQERVNSPYPDAAKFAALAQQAGANRMAGAGMGGGGGMPPRMPGGGGVRGAQGNGMVQPAPMGGGNPGGNNVMPGAMGGGMNPGGGFQGFQQIPGLSPDGFPVYDPNCPNGDCGGAWYSGGYDYSPYDGGYSSMPTGTGMESGSGGMGDPGQWGGYAPMLRPGEAYADSTGTYR